MSNKDELVLWVQGVEAYKRGDLEGALAAFEPILSLSKVAFNAGMIYTRFNDHASADTMYSAALAADPYLAVAFLQKAYAYFVLQDYSRAERCYNMIVELLLENDYIDYTQLGLKYRLYRCEVFFNRAMCAQLRGDDARALQDITAAQRCARTPDHNAVIGTAARAGVDDITLFTVPFEAVFEVPEAKQKNLDRRNYLKDARIVASNETETDAFAGFSGAAIIDPSLADEAAAQGKNATLFRRPAAAAADAAPARAATLARKDSPAPAPAAPARAPTLARPGSPANSLAAAAAYTGPPGAASAGVRIPVRTRASTFSDVRDTIAQPSPSTMPRRPTAANASTIPRPPGQQRVPQQPPPPPPADSRRRRSSDPIDEYEDGAARYDSGRPPRADPDGRRPSEATIQRTLAGAAPRASGPSSPFPDQRKLGPAAGIARSNTSSSGGSAGRVPTATAKPAPPGMTKVKVHFDGRTFGMLVPSDIRLTAFSDMIRSKQGLSQAPQISYPDEEDPDTMISVADDDDLALAIDSASGATVHFYCRAAGDLLDYY